MAGTKEGAAKRKQSKMTPEVFQEFVTLGETQGLHGDHPVYVVAPKRALKFGDKMLQAGDEVPGAHLWLRLESWINTGRIVEKTCR